MEDEQNTALVPCFLCGNGLDVRLTKNEKPYLVCDPCGVQIFIRGRAGIKKFEKWTNQIKGRIVAATSSQNTPMLALINRLTELRGKKTQLEEVAGILDGFFGDKSPELTAIEKEIIRLEEQLSANPRK